MTPLSIDELLDLAPAFVMGTLTSDELAQFELAMRDASMAEAITPEVAAHRQAVEVLSRERAVTPPPGLKQRVLARIASEPRMASVPIPAPSATPATPATPAPSPPSMSLERPGQDTSATPSARRAIHVPPIAIVRKSNRAPWVAATFAGIGLAASLLFAFDLTNQLRGVRSELTETQHLLQRTQTRLADRDATVGTLTEAGANLVLVQLSPAASPGPGIQLFWNVKSGTAVVHASGLAQVADNRTYVLWMIRDGKPEAVKLFKPDPDGHRLINGVELPRDMRGVGAFAVTEEPAEGSPQPTMTPFLIGTVAAPK